MFESFKKRMEGWKSNICQVIITVIKSIFFRFTSYCCLVFLLQWQRAQKSCKETWDCLGEEFKYHLVDWDIVCIPIRNGRLGLEVGDI